MANKSVSFLGSAVSPTNKIDNHGMENSGRLTLKPNLRHARGSTAAGASKLTQQSSRRNNPKKIAPSNYGNSNAQKEENNLIDLKEIIDSAIQPLNMQIHSLQQVVENLQSEIYVLKVEGLSKSGDIVLNKGKNDNTVNYVSSRPITYEQPTASSSVASVIIPANPPGPTLKKNTSKSKTTNPYTIRGATLLEPIAKQKLALKRENISYWKLAKGLKNRKKSDLTAPVDGDRQPSGSNVNVKYILASGFQKNVTKPCIIKFLKKIFEVGSFEVNEIRSNNNRTGAYSIVVPIELFNTFMDPAIWPKGVKVTEWFPAVSSTRKPCRTIPTNVTVMPISTPRPKIKKSIYR
ncbi:hypothetical protein O0L34_g2356 [Tuta absoluta]|nr:hypothetical protein O0L34_g2356 [Tuta absoluta]